MVQNILDGTLVSPFSNITSARFGIPWGVRVELDTEGIQDFSTVFTNLNVTFRVTSDLPVDGTFLYGITFSGGVVVAELRNFSPFTIFENFTMNGGYDPATSTFSFQEPAGTVKEEGAKFWLNVSIPGGFGQFPSISSAISLLHQHPFQFTEAGATNGVLKTIHLFEKPEKGLTLKLPYFERFGQRINEVNSVESDWQPSQIGQEGIIGLRVSDQIRASQPFEMKSEWRQGSLDGETTTQTVTPNIDMSFVGPLIDVFISEHPDCLLGFQPPVVPPPSSELIGAITYGDVSPPTDSGDGIRVIFPASPPAETQYRVQNLLTAGFTGSGTAACNTNIGVPGNTPPDGEIRATDGFRGRNRFLAPPNAAGWGFERWLEQ